MQVNESISTSYKLAFLGCYKRREIGNVIGLKLCVKIQIYLLIFSTSRLIMYVCTTKKVSRS